MIGIKHKRMTPETEADQRVRNEARLAHAIRALGRRYICHPQNRVQRLATEKR